MDTLTIELRRGGHTESLHPVSAVLVDAEGGLLERVGPPMATTWRSAAKPLQLEVSLGLLPPDTALTDEDLAVGASSHMGQPGHVARVQGLLEGGGCGVEHLFCGTHWPGHAESGRALIRRGGEAGPLHNNCSGKHAFMALACRAQGWPPDYRAPDHPLQQAILDSLQHRSGGGVLDAVIDGCGVPCWVLPLHAMARCWAQLALEQAAGETTPLGRIGGAMLRQPWHASGTDTLDGTVMQAATRPTVAKVGAQALLCLALPDEGLGIALKIRSGYADARAAALQALLDRWSPGRLPAEALAPWTVLRNWVGTEVGEQRAVWAASR